MVASSDTNSLPTREVALHVRQYRNRHGLMPSERNDSKPFSDPRAVMRSTFYGFDGHLG